MGQQTAAAVMCQVDFQILPRAHGDADVRGKFGLPGSKRNGIHGDWNFLASKTVF
jgi:hypothetical protein